MPIYPELYDGPFHELAESEGRVTLYPFLAQGVQTPDAYPRHHRRVYEIARAAYEPRLHERTSYSSGLTYTNDFTNGAWGKVNLSPTANALANPNDGAATASRLLETVTNGEHNTYAGYTFASATPHIFTVFIAGGLGRDWVRLRVFDGTVDRDAWFNVATGAVSSTHTTEFIRMPNPGQAWWRATICITPTSAAAGGVAIAVSTDGSTTSYAGDTAKGIYLWCANIRPGSIGSIGPAVEALGTIRTVSSPDLDPDDCFAYLVAESEPQPLAGDVVRLERTFTRLPGTQTSYHFESFSRPNMSGLKSGNILAASLDDGKSVHLWDVTTQLKQVLGVQNNQGTITTNSLPSGNIVVTLSDATAATFAANASQSTINAALNAAFVATGKLSYAYCVTDGTTVGLFWGRLVIGPSVSSIANPSGTELIWLQGNNSAQVKASGVTVTPDTKLLHVPSHGASVGDLMALISGFTFMAPATAAGISDTNYLALVLEDLKSVDVPISHLARAAAATVRYAVGSRDIRVRRQRSYYLPGVTMLANGTTLATPASIPATLTYTEGQTWLDQLVAASTHVAIRADDIEYLGPIIGRQVTAAIMAEAVDSLALT